MLWTCFPPSRTKGLSWASLSALSVAMVVHDVLEHLHSRLCLLPARLPGLRQRKIMRESRIADHLRDPVVEIILLVIVMRAELLIAHLREGAGEVLFSAEHLPADKEEGLVFGRGGEQARRSFPFQLLSHASPPAAAGHR